jgi:pectinesterase
MNFDFSELERGENMSYKWFSDVGTRVEKMHAKWLERGFLTKREQNPRQEKSHADERPEEPLVLECMAGSSLQKTLDAIPEDTDRETIVKVAPGRYREKVRLSGRRAGVKLVAADPRPGKTVISWNDTPSTPDGNGGTLGTFRSYTFYVDIPDFEMDGFTVENTGTPERLAATGGKEQAGQCVALFVAGDRDVFRRCRFLGWQDTVYAGGRSKSDAVRQAFDGCYIEGTVDFIFGGSVALFWNCDIHSIQGGYVTAGSHAEGLPFGYVFAKCRVTCGKGKKTSLGRPWRPYANITFIDTDFGDAVTPQGWNEWTTDFGRRVWRSAEYGCRQNGEVKRDAIVEVGGAKELRSRLEESGYSTVFDVVRGSDGWRPIGK